MSHPSAFAAAIVVAPIRAATDPASAIVEAARRLLPHLERGRRIDAPILRTAMERAFGVCDADGAWDWKIAYDACEVPTVLFVRKFGPAVRTKAASPAAMLPMAFPPSPGVAPEATTLLGWVHRRVRVIRANRVELTGFTDAMRERLSAYGLFHEIISWKLRMFVPTHAAGISVLAKVLERYPAVRISERAA
jgi:hypothetical protein